MTWITLHKIHPLSLTAYPSEGCEGLEPIQADIAYTCSSQRWHKVTLTFTLKDNLESAFMSLDCGSMAGRKPTQTLGEHANSTQKGVCILFAFGNISLSFPFSLGVTAPSTSCSSFLSSWHKSASASSSASASLDGEFGKRHRTMDGAWKMFTWSSFLNDLQFTRNIQHKRFRIRIFCMFIDLSYKGFHFMLSPWNLLTKRLLPTMIYLYSFLLKYM